MFPLTPEVSKLPVGRKRQVADALAGPDVAVGEVGDAVLGGLLRSAGDLSAAIDAAGRLADVCGCHEGHPRSSRR